MFRNITDVKLLENMQKKRPLWRQNFALKIRFSAKNKELPLHVWTYYIAYLGLGQTYMIQLFL